MTAARAHASALDGRAPLQRELTHRQAYLYRSYSSPAIGAHVVQFSTAATSAMGSSLGHVLSRPNWSPICRGRRPAAGSQPGRRIQSSRDHDCLCTASVPGGGANRRWQIVDAVQRRFSRQSAHDIDARFCSAPPGAGRAAPPAAEAGRGGPRPALQAVRDESFRIENLPPMTPASRGEDPALRALLRLIRAEGRDIIHAHDADRGPSRPYRRRLAGVPWSPTHVTASCSTNPRLGRDAPPRWRWNGSGGHLTDVP